MGDKSKMLLYTHILLMSNVCASFELLDVFISSTKSATTAGCVLKFMTFLFDSASSRGTICAYGTSSISHHDCPGDVKSQKLTAKNR